MTKKLISLICLFSMAAALLLAIPTKEEPTAAGTDITYPAIAVKPGVPIQAYPFDLRRVRLLAGPFREAMERDRKYLYELDSDRLLHNFRVNAGLPSTARPYGGWEEPKCELRGHSLGHYLSACALMVAGSGDEKLKAKADALVAELAKCQQALNRSGYLSAFPEEFFDRVESSQRVWAPYYTIHKIMAGLLDMYAWCGNRQALQVAEAMAGWVKKRCDRLDDAQMESMLEHTEQGGMNEVLANLYALTGNGDYLKLARRFDEKGYTEPLAKYQDRLKGLHVNSFIPNMIGSAREYEMSGDLQAGRIAEFFWKQVTGARSYATGGTSNDEVWRNEPYVFASELGRNSHESCCTYNMLKLTRHLFGWTADPRLVDYYERALFNGILPTQDPASGMMMYYVPMGSGFYKTFMTHDDSFWCCTGTGMENHAKYGDSIYFHDDQGIYVNLFIASELNWPEKGLRLRQETRFPDEQGTALVFTVSKPVELVLRVRIPLWVEAGGRVLLNGKALESFASPGSYLVLKRTWKNGDRLDIALPMGLHLQRLPDAPDIAAIMFGPLVLAGQLGSEGLTNEKVYGPYGPEGDPVVAPELYLKGDDLATSIQPVAGQPLTFRTLNAGKPKDVTLVPFYKLFGQRYAIYWQIHPVER